MSVQSLEILKARYDLVISLIIRLKDKIANLPEGRISIKHRGTRTYYYYSIGNSEEKIINSDNIKLAENILQKNYLEKVLKSSEQEAEVIKRAIKQYPDPVAEEIYDQLSEERKVLVKPIVTPIDQFVKEWQEKPYTHKAIKEGVPFYTTLRGEKVRSKSEQIIADRLYAKGIPYKYECPLKVGGKIIHPDFTILRKSDRKEIYLEHLGMFDDDKYQNDNVPRLNDYFLNGYMLGDKLFLSFESSNTPLKTEVIDRMIDELFM